MAGAWYARHVQVRPGMPASLSGTLQSMGGAMPYALSAKFAVVINALVDPAELMLPPHFTAGQARRTAAAMLHGDSDWAGIVRRGLPATVAAFRPRRG